MSNIVAVAQRNGLTKDAIQTGVLTVIISAVPGRRASPSSISRPLPRTVLAVSSTHPLPSPKPCKHCALSGTRSQTVLTAVALPLSANLDHNGAHACTARVFLVCLLDFFKFEGSLYGHRDFSGP